MRPRAVPVHYGRVSPGIYRSNGCNSSVMRFASSGVWRGGYYTAQMLVDAALLFVSELGHRMFSKFTSIFNVIV